MLSGKRKHRTKRTTPGKGLRPLTEREANETVGGRTAQPDISDAGGNNSDFAQRIGYVQG